MRASAGSESAATSVASAGFARLAEAGSEASAFPDPEDLAPLEPDALKRYGFSMTKARTIIATARAIVAGDLDLEYVLLRGLGRLHVFPGDDVGAHNKLRRLFGIATPLDYESVERLVARWHPYAGVVYFHLLLDTLSQHGLVAQS
jgi:DNA-3-methyladenine glycosylase II